MAQLKTAALTDAPDFAIQVYGCDLAQLPALPASVTAEIKHLLWKHSVLVFRDQQLDADSHVATARCFGDISATENILYLLNNRPDRAHPKYPELYCFSTGPEFDGDAAQPRGVDAWHSDFAYMHEDYPIAMFRAVHIEDDAAGTVFMSTRLVYDALPDDLRRRIEGQRAYHTAPHLSDVYNYVKPAVRPHPVTGKRALFLSELFTVRLEDMSPEHSEQLLAEIFRFANQERFFYRHRWRPNDVLMWDNMASCHRRDGPSVGTRVLHRAITHGPTSYA